MSRRLRRILVSGFVLLLAVSFMPVTVSASSPNVSCTPLVKKTFLSFPSWYEYIPMGKTDQAGSCTIPDIQITQGGFNGKGILLILLAIVDMLLRVAGLVALMYVVYGGIRYVMSQGSPDKTKQAQSTLQDAIIGLVISLVAIALVAFIGHSIG